MAKKTALRRLCKLLPTSPELARAVTLDEQAEASVPQQLDILATDEVEDDGEVEVDGATHVAEVVKKLAAVANDK
jgi:recombinational DNA repair protein RecT